MRISQPNERIAVTDQADRAAVEAAQRVVEDVSSWDYSAEGGTIADRLDDGLRQAQVTLDDEERARVLEEIDAMKDEGTPAPRVQRATPAG